MQVQEIPIFFSIFLVQEHVHHTGLALKTRKFGPGEIESQNWLRHWP